MWETLTILRSCLKKCFEADEIRIVDKEQQEFDEYVQRLEIRVSILEHRKEHKRLVLIEQENERTTEANRANTKTDQPV